MKKLFVVSATLLSFTANAAWQSDDGALSIGGNVEINTDAVNKTEPTREGGDVSIADDSRFLLEVKWENRMDSGEYIRAQAQPLMKTNGSVELDDSYVALGNEEKWEFQVGRFEAMELFSNGKDTVAYVAEGGDAFGGGVYYYKGHEGRGRRGDNGQARVGGYSGNWSYEISSAFGNSAEILTGGDANLDEIGIGRRSGLESNDNSFVVRPAVNYLNDYFSLSMGAEYDLSGEAIVTGDNVGYLAGKDLSDRYGASVRSEFFLGDNTTLRFSGAYQDIQEVWVATLVNANFEYRRLGAGVSVAHNVLDDPGKENISSYVSYVAYTLPVMGFKNAELILAASYSETTNAYGDLDNNFETLAVRSRLVYKFE